MNVPVTPDPIGGIAGDDFAQSFRFTAGGVPEDLSTWGGWACQWRRRASSEDAVDLTVDSSAAATGVITITATTAQTRSMLGSGVFDIQASTPTVRTFIRGRAVWEMDVTRD